MAGIAAMLDLEAGLPSSQPLVESMVATLRHRGPNGRRVQSDGPVTIGTCTHPVLDRPPSTGLPLVLDGDILNVPEIAARLGIEAASQEEIVFRAWSALGPSCLELLEGAFAFVVWDEQAQSLTCVRDRFGLKPLYSTIAGGRFRVASEIRALLSDPVVPRVPDDARVSSYLAYSLTDHDSGTLLRGIHHVPAAHIQAVSRTHGCEPPRRWYRVGPTPSDEPVAAHVRALLEDSVARRLRGDGVIGVTLSGGVDSSSILATAARRRLEEGGALPIAVVARTAEPRTDEWRYAQLVLRRYGVDAVQVRPDARGLVHDFDAFSDAVEEPVHAPSVYGHWRTMRAVREAGIDIVLEGQFGERFGGIGAWYPQAFFDMAARGRLVSVVRELAARRREQDVPVRRSLLDVAKLLVPASVRAAHASTPAWLSADASATARTLPRRWLALQHHLLTVADVPQLCREVDRDATAFSLAERSPFQDEHLVEYALSLPTELLHNDGVGKAPLLDAMRGIVPDEILDRPVKQGFTVDADAWVRGAFGDTVAASLAGDAAASRPYWDAAAMRKLVEEARSGRASAGEVWRAYSVERWLERVVDPQRSAPVT